jgi:hypothetical protein
LVVWVGKYQCKLFRRCEVDRVIKTGIRADATLEATRSAINLAEQLHLQPPLVSLDSLRRRKRSGKFRDSEEADRGD